MVWPILISVDVTPRISADVAAGSIKQATAPSAPTEVTKRISFPPRCRQPRSGARSGRYLVQRAGTCHDGRTGATFMMAQGTAPAQKNAASPPRLLFSVQELSGLRLRLEAGIRVGARTRLAGGRHR